MATIISRQLLYRKQWLYYFISNFSINAAPLLVEKPFVHPFKKALTKESVVQYLVNNIVYNKNGIVAFNKPAGLAKTRPSGQIVTHFGGQMVGESVYADEVLEEVCSHIPGTSSASIVKFPERYTSGVMILATTDEARTRITKAKSRAKASEPCDSYLAVSLGKPALLTDSLRFGLQLCQKDTGGKRIPMLVDQWSEQSRKKGIVKLFRCSHNVLASSQLASLIQVAITTTKSNALRLYFATKLLSPLLGDSIFGSRVKFVLGVPTLIDPWSDVANSPPKVSKDVLSALQLSGRDTGLVQLVMHLSEVRLPKLDRGQDVIIRAPPPSTFCWVCRRLELPEPMPSGELVY